MQHFRRKRIKTLNFNAFVKTPGDKLSLKGTFHHLIINYKKKIFSGIDTFILEI